MALGEFCREVEQKDGARNLLLGLYYHFYGVPDLQSHIRWRVAKAYVDFDRRHILDVGCGSGLMTFEVAKRAKRAKMIIGLDSSCESIEVAKRGQKTGSFNHVDFCDGDVTNLPFEDGTFDEVLCFAVLEHVEDDYKAVSEISRVLKKEGLLIITSPTLEFRRYFGDKFANAIGHNRAGYTVDQIHRMLQLEGIKVLNYKYYTLFLGSSVSSLFYKHISAYPKLHFALSPVLNAVSFADFFGDSKFARHFVIRGVESGPESV